MTIGETLKALREESKPELTQTQLGKILYMSQKKISRMETNEAKPTPEDIKAYCLFYKISADYILGLPKGLTTLNAKTQKKGK